MMALFFIAIAFIAYTYILYPLLIVMASKLLGHHIHYEIKEGKLPSITMIIVAFNEEKNIEAKLANCFELDYPSDLLEVCIVSDGSTDRTADMLRAKKSIFYIEDTKNRGKPHQLNKAIKQTQSEIIVFSDVRQIYDKGALRKLVRNFADEKIGCVSGELVFKMPEDPTGGNIGLYWAYEKALRKAESRLDSTLGVTGAIYAIRRELLVQIPDDTILDDIEIPLGAFLKGYRVVFEPEAVAYDIALTDLKSEFNRKARTLAGNYQLFSRNRWLLLPWKNRIFVQTISHKLFRLFIPWMLLVVLVTSSKQEGTAFTSIFCLQIFFYGLGILALIFDRLRENRLLNFVAVFLTLNAAAVTGLYKYITRSASAKWRN